MIVAKQGSASGWELFDIDGKEVLSETYDDISVWSSYIIVQRDNQYGFAENPNRLWIGFLKLRGCYKMYCRHCGKNLPDGASFCPGCGKSLIFTIPNSNYMGEARTFWKEYLRFAKAFVQRLGIKKMTAILSVVILTVVLVIIVGAGGKHDLSGVYQTADFFPFQQIEFDKSGHFSAVYYDGGYSETYTGKYQKQSNGEYACRFTDGSSSSGSPVLNYEASSMGDQCEVAVRKIDENALEVWMVPKIGYWAWNGKTVYFYK